MTYGAQAWDNPDAFVGRATQNAYEPFPMITGSNYSSFGPASAFGVHWVQPEPMAVQNIVVQNSLNASVPQATSAASSGSDGYSYAYSAFLYSRQDYLANSSNLTFLTSGSFGLSASVSYTGTAQTFGMSWATDTTGGVSGISTTSSNGAWSNYASGARLMSIPFKANIPAGEYWLFMQHSSTTATSNSNVTLVSMSNLAIVGAQAVFAGLLGQSATAASVFGGGQNAIILNGAPTTSAAMGISQIVGAGKQPWIALSNA